MQSAWSAGRARMLGLAVSSWLTPEKKTQRRKNSSSSSLTRAALPTSSTPGSLKYSWVASDRGSQLKLTRDACLRCCTLPSKLTGINSVASCKPAS